MNQWILNERYQLQKRLSQKGARHTFIAQDLQTNQPVVVKVLFFGLGCQWQDHKLFERGAAALKTLSFQGIPKYLDYFDVEIGQHKGFAQVQSYIPAKSLQEHIQAGRSFSEKDILQIALQLLKILDYLHQRQPAVIHRDIKPSNILLADRTGNHVGQVYLVDFDSVKTGSTRSDHTMTIVGTYGYMPPEQFSGKARPASDLYSLGATLIYAATGKHPADLPQKDMRIAFESHVSLKPALMAWLKCMTNPNLDRRPKSATQAIQLLRKATLPGASGLAQAAAPSMTKPIPQLSGSAIRIRRTQQAIEIVFPPRQPAVGACLMVLIIAGLPSGLITLSLFFGMLSAFASGQLVGGLGFILTLLIPALVAFLTLICPLCELMMRDQATKLLIEPHSITETDAVGDTQRHNMARGQLKLVSNHSLSFVELRTPDHTFKLPANTKTEREWLLQTLGLQLRTPITYAKAHP